MVVTEGRPDETGLAMARELDELRVPVIAILDSGVAFALERERCAWRLLVLPEGCFVLLQSFAAAAGWWLV